MSWRDQARPIIERVLRETAGQSEAAIKLALRNAYPFGERRYHPYKIWCDEIRRQRGAPAASARVLAEQKRRLDEYHERLRREGVSGD